MFAKRNAVVETPADAAASAGGGVLIYAGFWARVAALLVDSAIVMIFGIILFIVLGMAMGGTGLAIGYVIFFFVQLLYWPVLESSARQATFGKQLLGIQVTDADGNRTSFIRALLRNLAKIISSIPLGIGFLLAAFTSRKQALHDMITSCLVVRAGPSSFLKAVVAAVGGLVIAAGASYYYVTEVYLPQLTKDMGREMEKAMKGAMKGQPGMKAVPARPPVAKAPAAATKPPVARAAPAVSAPPAAGPATQIAAVTPSAPPATAPTPAPAPKEATPAVKPAATAPAKPAAAPMAAQATPVKPAAAPVKKAEAAPKPAPEAAPSADEKPKAKRRVAKPKPAAPAETAAAPPMAPARTPKYNDVMTAVMYRDRAGAAELLELGWWVDRPDSNGVTPLMAAAMNGDASIVQLLLKHGADPNRSGPGGSVLAYAAQGRDAKVIELLKRAGTR